MDTTDDAQPIPSADEPPAAPNGNNSVPSEQEQDTTKKPIQVDSAAATLSDQAAEATKPQPPAGQSDGAVPSAGGQASRILLVEDDDSLANVYVTRLQSEGFDVRRVNNGEDALATALSYHPDMVLLDVMMPKVSGFDVLDILRNTPETANLKVIMLTALGQDSEKQRAESLGVDEYLVKSQVVIADVVDRIRHHLNQA